MSKSPGTGPGLFDTLLVFLNSTTVRIRNIKRVARKRPLRRSRLIETIRAYRLPVRIPNLTKVIGPPRMLRVGLPRADARVSFVLVRVNLRIERCCPTGARKRTAQHQRTSLQNRIVHRDSPFHQFTSLPTPQVKPTAGRWLVTCVFQPSGGRQ